MNKELIIDENHPIAEKCFSLFSGVATYQIKKDLLKIINTAISEYIKMQEDE